MCYNVRNVQNEFPHIIVQFAHLAHYYFFLSIFN